MFINFATNTNRTKMVLIGKHETLIKKYERKAGFQHKHEQILQTYNKQKSCDTVYCGIF